MWKYPKIFDVLVIGAGHAGCEAAHAAARMGAKTRLVDDALRVLNAVTNRERLGLHVDTTLVQHREGVTRAVTQRQHHVIGLDLLAERTPHMRLVADQTFEYQANILIRNPDHLWVHPSGRP